MLFRMIFVSCYGGFHYLQHEEDGEVASVL